LDDENMKKLATLGLALQRLGLEDHLLSLGSLSRRVDMLSYNRKILNLFFNWLSKKILENQRKWERIEESERFNIIDEPNIHHQLSEIFDDIFITVSVNQNSGKVEALGGVQRGGETLIGSLDLSSLKDEERRIANKATSYFIFKFLPSFTSFPNFREGAVALSEGAVGYSVRIDVDGQAGYIAENIPKIYKTLLEFMVHENTHIQQSVLADELSDVNPGLINERYDAGEEIDFIELINKNKLNQPYKWEEMEEEEEDLPPLEETPARELSLEEKIEKAFRMIDMIIKPAKCPDLNLQEKSIARKLIEDGEEYQIVSVISSENYLECEKKAKEERADELKEIVTEYHADPETDIGESEIFNYYSRQIEVEAYIRGWRSRLSSSKGKENLAKYFKKQFRSVPEEEMSRENLANLWNKFKDTYRKMNYPEKYLGTDEEALLSDKEYLSKKTKGKRYGF
jgi:hypothetical protein